MSSNTRVGLTTQEQNVLAAVNEGSLSPHDEANTVSRRAKNRIRRLNHHAYHARDVEETRHFYEDILEMPMTVFLQIPEEVFTAAPLPYSHFFFELGDGSAIAFFDYPAFHDDKVDFNARTTVYDHHVALLVGSDDDVQYFQKKLEAAGVKTEYSDHGVFRSVYFTDPNGLNLELCWEPPIIAEFSYRAEKIAHSELKKWQKVRASVSKG